MATIAIIGASYLQLPLILKCKELNHKTIGFAWEDGAVGKHHFDKFYPISIIEKEIILIKCIEENIDAVISIASDVAVTTVSFISESMSLLGNSISSSILSSDKYLMRKRFLQAGIQSPKFYHATNFNKDDNEFQKLKFPLIIKPVDSSGSKGVSIIKILDEISEKNKKAKEASISGNTIIEEFITGREVSVETISNNGSHFLLAITDKKTSGEPHFVELEHHQPSLLSLEVQSILYELTLQGLNALEIRYGAAHSEFIITEDNQIYITEIGARMGGDFIGSHLVELSTGYDFLKGVIDVALGSFTIPKTLNNKYSGVYFLSCKSEWVEKYIENSDNYPEIKYSDQNASISSFLTRSSDRSGYLIYQCLNKRLKSKHEKLK